MFFLFTWRGANFRFFFFTDNGANDDDDYDDDANDNNDRHDGCFLWRLWCDQEETKTKFLTNPACMSYGKNA